MGMEVTYLDHMGSDLTVVNAARVSFAKESDWKPVGIWGQPDCDSYIRELKEEDTKLISYLAKHNHWSPFAHCSLQLRVKAPIFVARQLAKHQVGLSWNEVSRRYVDDEPEFFTPDKWRKRAENVKQGSSNEEVVSLDWYFDSNLKAGLGPNISRAYKELIEHSERLYQVMIGNGVAPEQARMVLPLSMYTEWVWTGSLYAFARVCKLRLDSHAQKETQEIAKMIAAICKEHWPVSWKVLMEN